MELSYRFTLPASVEEVWNAFNHPNRIEPCFPGASLTGINGNEFAGSVRVKLGPTPLDYSGTATFVGRNAEERRLVIEASGEDRRGHGTMTAAITATFDNAEWGTDMTLTMALTPSGRAAQLGDGVIADVADRILAQLIECVSSKFAAGLGDPATEEELAASGPPAETLVAAADDHVTGEKPAAALIDDSSAEKRTDIAVGMRAESSRAAAPRGQQDELEHWPTPLRRLRPVASQATPAGDAIPASDAITDSRETPTSPEPSTGQETPASQEAPTSPQTPASPEPSTGLGTPEGHMSIAPNEDAAGVEETDAEPAQAVPYQGSTLPAKVGQKAGTLAAVGLPVVRRYGPVLGALVVGSVLGGVLRRLRR